LKHAREIRLYSNRRLYDPEVSRYVTMDDVFALMRRGVEISIRDADTGVDCTRKILVELLIRHESGQRRHEPLFTDENLMDLIRLAGEERRELAAEFLEYSLKTLQEQETETAADEASHPV
jgi:polyhydroxyalkanoate synthesis repressor PhaR